MAVSDVTTPDRPLAFRPGTLSIWDRAGGAPGIVFLLLVVAAIVVAIDANTRSSLGAFLVALPAWMAIALVWSLRMGIGISQRGLRMPATHWVRWLSIPVAMGTVFALTRTDALFDLRFELSRPALDAMAADVLGGGPEGRGWVGLYEVGRVEVAPKGLRFVIDRSFGRIGLAWSPDSDPQAADSGTWCCATYEPMGDGWWYWYEPWLD